MLTTYQPCPRCIKGSILSEWREYACLACGYDPTIELTRRYNTAYEARLKAANAGERLRRRLAKTRWEK